MTKVSKRLVDPKKFSHYINNLWSAFLLMDSKEDIRLLFKDLFTHTEYKMFAKRLEIARRLLEGGSYESIKENLKVSANPITAISNILNERGEGLREAHKKLLKIEEKYLKRQKEYTDNLSNPFKIKSKRRTVGSVLLKAGVKALDRTIRSRAKKKSAKKHLSI